MQTTTAKKSLGQHWLKDIDSLKAIVDFADIKNDDFILEIGPGNGALTDYLIKKAKQVLAVEFDDALAKSLKSKVKSDVLQVVNQDILEFDFTKLPVGYKIVANIPYYLTSKLVRNISETTNKPEVVVLLIQKEVAQRLASGPGDMSLLALSAKIYFDISLGVVVGKEAFDPPPKVDSQVVKLIKLDQPLLEEKEVKGVFTIAKLAFNSKRKTLLNSLSGGLKIEKNQLEDIIKKYPDIDPNLRPQNLDVADWQRIHQIFQKEDLL